MQTTGVRRVGRLLGRPGWAVLAALAWGGLACDESPPTMEPESWEVESSYQRANAALGEGKLGVAEKELRKVLDLDGKHVAAHTKLGRTLAARAAQEPALRATLLAEALRELERAAELEPQGQVVWAELARVAQQAGQHARAQTALEKVVALGGPVEETLRELGQVRVAMGQHAAAEAGLRQAVAQGHDYGGLSLDLGRLLLGQGKADEARKVLEGVEACPKAKGDLKRPPACPTGEYYEAQDELGGLAVRQGRLADARAIYLRLVEMFPEDYMAWEVLAALDEREGKLVEAEARYRQSLEVDRLHTSVWLGLGRVLVAQGRREEAGYALRKADAYLAKSPEQALELADELVKLGDLAWARASLERARILAEDRPELLARIEQKLAGLPPPGAAPAPQPAPAPDAGQQVPP
ncbi:MAG TPA: tetratricopeptide repeat protein [Myxococcota bacterium]|nr:tetratricopeptide repeat protein [Myxococcota bacterium]HRY94164.1 tetratricopeptide repeat protein [Myxococcota bacterium]HSA23185.1 tetratricopeptide repeat protein [Myxococcota bacterium]